MDAWKVRCNPCSKDFCKRTITDHLRNQHEASKVMMRAWHIRKDATTAKRGHSLTGWSRFRWRGRALADGPALSLSLFLRWARPLPPGDGEDSGDAASDAARLYSTPLSPQTQDEMEAGPTPPPAAGPSTDGVRQRLRWEQDSLASEERLVVRMDRHAKPMCTKPRGPLMLRCGKDIVWLWRTSWRPTTLAVAAVLSRGIY